jgi:hypothetical protein
LDGNAHLRHRLEHPVILWVLVHRYVEARDAHENVVGAVVAGFHHAHGHGRVLGQSGSEDETSGAAADDEVVVGFSGELGDGGR